MLKIIQIRPKGIIREIFLLVLAGEHLEFFYQELFPGFRIDLFEITTVIILLICCDLQNTYQPPLILRLNF